MNCAPPPRRAKAGPGDHRGRRPRRRARQHRGSGRATRAGRPPAPRIPGPSTCRAGRTAASACTSRPRRGRARRPETSEAAGGRGLRARSARAAGTRAPPMKNVSAGTSGRISIVLWMNTGCLARNSAARRPSRRLAPRRPTEDQRTQTAPSAPATGRAEDQEVRGRPRRTGRPETSGRTARA